jgi:hypothetical protein
LARDYLANELFDVNPVNQTFTWDSSRLHRFFLSACYHDNQQVSKNFSKQIYQGECKMKKFVISILVVAVVAVALGTAGFVYAQSPAQTPAAGTGYGMHGQGGRGGMMGQGMAAGTQDGLLHDAMIAIFAQKLGISVEDLNTRLANGETMAQIAVSQGLSLDEFQTIMADARSQAIDQAVKDGTLTQAQADTMKQRGAGMMKSSGFGAGMGGGRGARGNGQSINPDCPYNQTNP